MIKCFTKNIFYVSADLLHLSRGTCTILAQSLFEQTVNSCCLVAKQHHTNVTKAKKMTKIKCVSK